MTIRFQPFIALALITSFMLHSSLKSDSDYVSDKMGACRLEYGYTFGDYIGNNENYQELGLFIAPFLTEERATFLDARGYRLDDSRFASSVGIGHRWIPSCISNVVGVNVYYDYFEGKVANFNELGAGLEFLGSCFEIRVNGYYHIGSNRKSSSTSLFDDYSGNYSATCKKDEFTYDRIDAEVGRVFDLSRCGTSFYIGLGPYYCHSKLNSFYGGFLRADLTLNQYLSLQARVSHDDTYKTNAQGRILLSIPLEKLFCWDTPCQTRLIQPVRRDGLMFTDTCCDWTWNW